LNPSPWTTDQAGPTDGDLQYGDGKPTREQGELEEFREPAQE
jgi:hypothetical protein